MDSSHPSLTVKKNTGARTSLWLVALAVLLASSVWFSGTAAGPVLKQSWALTPALAAWLTIAVQLGFILGTLVYSVLNIADLLNARRVFFLSALLGGTCNALFTLFSASPHPALVFRFLTGVTLAGVYPVGMRIIAQWTRQELGWGLSVMVGALTLGTAAPYGLFALGAEFDWRLIMFTASLLAVAGGILVEYGVGDGPYLKDTPGFDPRAALKVFRIRRFRLQALGYFGHMWELYAFWALVGSWLGSRVSETRGRTADELALTAFLAIACGAFGCVLGGVLSKKWGERRVALAAITGSGALCALSGWLYGLPTGILIPAVFLWGMLVVADSPQFSALAARFCPPHFTGTALTIQNGIGFAVTVISIQMTALFSQVFGWRWAFLLLAPGPIVGAAALIRLKGNENV